MLMPGLNTALAPTRVEVTASGTGSPSKGDVVSRLQLYEASGSWRRLVNSVFSAARRAGWSGSTGASQPARSPRPSAAERAANNATAAARWAADLLGPNGFGG